MAERPVAGMKDVHQIIVNSVGDVTSGLFSRKPTENMGSLIGIMRFADAAGVPTEDVVSKILTSVPEAFRPAMIARMTKINPNLTAFQLQRILHTKL